MSLPKVTNSAKPQPINSGTALVLPVKKALKQYQSSSGEESSQLLANLDFEHLGIPSQGAGVLKLQHPDGGLLVIVDTTDRSPSALREAGGSVAQSLLKQAKVVVDFRDFEPQQVEALVEGLLLGSYDFAAYRGLDKKSKVRIKEFIVLGALSKSRLKRAEILAKAVHATRDLVNQPANDLFPASFAEQVKMQALDPSLKVEIWDEKRLVKERCGGLVAVGAGSTRPPRLVKISYVPKRGKFHLALVGKGITFDSGGLSLKPAESMVGMKYDMTGAATVMQATLAIAALALPIKVTAFLCLAENLPSGSATRPNDIITARNGKSIEVLNTDAEGRLVLADGLSLASELKPDLIVDFATLTGAATIALGNRYAGVMGDQAAVSLVSESVADAGELAWPMPLPAELRPLLNSEIADIANVKIGARAGGMLIGGHFLREFIGDRKAGEPISWAHIDMAGPANNDGSAYGHTPKGATGALVRSAIALAERLSSR